MRRLALLAAAAGATAAVVAVMIAGGAAGARPAPSKRSLPTLKLALNGKSVKVSGRAVSGAVSVQTTVTNEKKGEPTLFELNRGVTLRTFGMCVARARKHGGDLNYLQPCGRLLFNAFARAGTSRAQTVLGPGNYLALDTQHSKNPPFAPFVVKPSASPAPLPTPGGTVASIEFAFRGTDHFLDGELVRVINEGFLVHMDVFGRVKSVKAANKVMRLLRAGRNRAAEKLFIGKRGGFAGPLSRLGMQQVVVNEKPGIYVQACFMRTQDGRYHTRLGMERMFTIIK